MHLGRIYFFFSRLSCGRFPSSLKGNVISLLISEGVGSRLHLSPMASHSPLAGCRMPLWHREIIAWQLQSLRPLPAQLANTFFPPPHLPPPSLSDPCLIKRVGLSCKILWLGGTGKFTCGECEHLILFSFKALP